MFLVTGESLCLWNANWQWIVWSYLSGAWKRCNTSPLILLMCVQIKENVGWFFHGSPITSHCNPWIKTDAKRVRSCVRSPSFPPTWGFFLPFGTQCLYSQWGTNVRFGKPLRKNSKTGRAQHLACSTPCKASCSFALKDLIFADKPLIVQDVVILVYKWGDWDGCYDSWTSKPSAL